MKRTLSLVALLAFGCPRPVQVVEPNPTVDRTPAAAGLPAHPDELTYSELSFTPPAAADYRHELAGGIPAYILTDTELPLITLSMSFAANGDLDPAGKTGRLDAMADQIREGGSSKLSPSELDERFEFLAANVSIRRTSVGVVATIDCLKDNFDDVFAEFMDMMRNPRFDEERFRLYKETVTEDMKQRNDDASDILARNWVRLVYGDDHYSARVQTRTELEGLTEEDLRAAHAQIIQPGNLIISVSGDVTAETVLPKIEAALEGWKAGEKIGDPPAPDYTIAPGVYHVEKDIPQGKVRIGLRGITRDDADGPAVDVMNEILGGGGFTSRLMNRIRSDEGLAYSVYSYFARPHAYPGTFGTGFETKSSTVALATAIAFEEYDRIRNEPVSEKELSAAKASIIGTFPRTFESKSRTAGIFVDDAWTKRPADHWTTYRDRIEAVTLEDVQRVAKAYIRPEEMVLLVVGKWEDIEGGDLDGRAKMEQFFGGKVNHLPLRDPFTQKALE